MIPKASQLSTPAPFGPKSLRADLIKAGRALANITAQELADASQLGIATIKRAEAAAASDETSLTASNADRVIETFRVKGVVFIPDGADGMGYGVRLVSPRSLKK